MTTKETVLFTLRTGGSFSDSQIAMAVGRPEPSVRRAIQELRKDGHNISFAPYRLGDK